MTQNKENPKLSFKRFVFISILHLPVILGIIIITNYFVDVDNLFHNKKENRLAQLLLKGNNLTNLTKYDERLLQKSLIANNKINPEVVVIGSHRTFLIDSSNFPGKTFYNNSVNGATIEDIITIYSLYEQKKCIPKHIIIGIDPWVLNEKNNQKRWKSVTYEYNKALLEFGLGSISVDTIKKEYNKLISLSYFIYSLKKQHKPERLADITKNRLNKFNTKLKDGSLVYGESFRKVDQIKVDQKAKSFIKGKMFGIEGFRKISSKNQYYVEGFIDHLKSKNIQITFYLSPYHPIVYDFIKSKNKYKCIIESEKYFLELAKKYQIDVVGSFDPSKLSFDNSNFYDGMISNEKGVKKLLLTKTQKNLVKQTNN